MGEDLLCDWTDEEGIKCRRTPYVIQTILKDRTVRVFCYKHLKEWIEAKAAGQTI